MRATKAQAGASVASTPHNWTGKAGKPGMGFYGVGFTPRSLCLKDKDGEPFRDEMDPREFMVWISWYMPQQGLFMDMACGTGVSGLASLRCNTRCLLIDNDKDPDLLKKAWRRICQYHVPSRGVFVGSNRHQRCPSYEVGARRGSMATGVGSKKEADPLREVETIQTGHGQEPEEACGADAGR